MRRNVLTANITANQQSQLWAGYEADHECDGPTCWQEIWGAVMTAKREVYVLKRVRTSGECLDIMQRCRKLSYSIPCRYLEKLRLQGLV